MIWRLSKKGRGRLVPWSTGGQIDATRDGASLQHRSQYGLYLDFAPAQLGECPRRRVGVHHLARSPPQLIVPDVPSIGAGAYPGVLTPAFVVSSSILLHALSLRQLIRKGQELRTHGAENSAELFRVLQRP